MLYKIEIPANRYDLLCVEGISRALRVFLGIDNAPVYRVITPPADKILRIVQKKETLSIRPFVVGAILRNVTFNPDSFASFIDLQDKLHQNIGRKRTLVAIGTHDLDTIQAPFAYEALPKKDISFVPLSETQEFDGEALFHYYNTKQPPSHLKPYLYITESSPVQPVIYDAKRVVCSLPPIINGEHSKITLQTRNVFIECTGTDATKLSVTLNQVLTMFAQYTATPFEIEAVEIVNEATGTTALFPQMADFNVNVNVAYVNSAIGIDITAEQMVGYLKKMSMAATLSADGTTLAVAVPPTRSDILHECDIMEDIAISYGFNKLPRTVPQCYTQGKFNKLNSLSDALREQVAQAGFTEVLTWVLLSFDDNYRFMQPKDVQGEVLDIKAAASTQAGSSSSGLLEKQPPLIVHPLLASPKAITLANPKSLDFQLVRTTMLPGLLKALSNNQGQVNLPIRLFECGDIGFQCAQSDVGARNQRRIGALYCDVRSGFEVIQGLLERIMTVNGVHFAPTVAQYRATRARAAEKREAARKVAEAAEKKKAKAKASKKGAAEESKEDAAPAAAAAPVDDHEEAEWKVVDTFSLRRSSHPSYFPGRCADIVLHRLAQQDEIVVGQFGILHPDVINQFDIPYVCSALEINLEYFL